jgi:sorting nexin-41/42
LPKNILKAPPLDAANPSQAHNYLPVPANNAKLKSSGSTSSSGTPVSPPSFASLPSAAAHTKPGPQVFGRFPSSPNNLSEEELDPYFTNFETSSQELERLLQGSMEKVNRRMLAHLSQWSEDMADLGARLNAFSLSEQSPSLAAAIEKVGQAVDSTYVATGELSHSLSANFAEPMRESAQFAGVVRNVLRYRILKRVQEEMTKEELDKKRSSLESLENSEAEAKRLSEHLGAGGSSASPRRTPSQRSSTERTRHEEDTASIDSDFPPTHGDTLPPPSASQGIPESSVPQNHRKSQSGNFVTNKIFGRINHAIHGIVDVDPERTRRDQIGKTRESIVQLEQALQVAETDIKDASTGVLKDLQRFQSQKEEDLKRYMVRLRNLSNVCSLTLYRLLSPDVM